MVYAVHKAGATVAGSDDACRPGRSRGYVAVVRTVGYGVDHRCSGNSVGERYYSGYMVCRGIALIVSVGIFSRYLTVIVATVHSDALSGGIYLAYQRHSHECIARMAFETHGSVACHITYGSIPDVSGHHTACHGSGCRDFQGAGRIEHEVLYSRARCQDAEEAVVLPGGSPVRHQLQIADRLAVPVEVSGPGIACNPCILRSGRADGIPDRGPVRDRSQVYVRIHVHPAVLGLPFFD